jgi:DNA-binding response OmpR family regulator
LTDLYIIDLSLTDWSGFDLIKRLRLKNAFCPIIIISWYNDTEKKVYWLDIWADDYIAKPFSPNELLARIRNILKRTYRLDWANIIKYKNITFDMSSKSVLSLWKPIDLTRKEKQIIELFLLNIWSLITKTKLINSVWWDYSDTSVSDNTINSTLSKVRRKLWYDFNLKTIVNEGYILE